MYLQDHLNGTEEQVERNFPMIGPEFVKYYLSIRVDDEIEFDKPIDGDVIQIWQGGWT